MNIRSYPTYEEWKHDNFKVCSSYSFVLILPMRNGNSIFNISAPPLYFRSYPTYEEWKQRLVNINFKQTSVLILPMRNGNFFQWAKKPHPIMFLSYLWGMETRIFYFVITPGYIKVLILPMRNGNRVRADWKWRCFQFLSYLWGMETC